MKQIKEFKMSDELALSHGLNIGGNSLNGFTKQKLMEIVIQQKFALRKIVRLLKSVERGIKYSKELELRVSQLNQWFNKLIQY